MNEILQKRIEKAAHQYIQSDAVAPENMQLAFGDFINGAKWTLQNQWIPVEEALPDYEEDVLVTNDVGDYWFSHRTENDNVMQDKNNFASVDSIFNITHWMPIPSLEGGEK